MAFRTWAETHTGTVRKHNEDSMLARPEIGLWAVADGAGGHQSGEVASGRLAEALAGLPAGISPSDSLAAIRQAVSAVHAELQAEAARRGEGAMIASTLVVLLIGAGHFACLWAGDSRIYLLRGGDLQPLTRDHSLVQELVDSGLIRPEQAEAHPQANVITRAIGAGEAGIELDKVIGQWEPGDRFLLCSDGLCKCLDDATLARLTAADDAAAALIGAALAAQARDNITAIVVEAATETTAGPA